MNTSRRRACAVVFLVTALFFLSCSCDFEQGDFTEYAAPKVWSVTCNWPASRFLKDGNVILVDYGDGGCLSVNVSTGQLNYRHIHTIAVPGYNVLTGDDLMSFQTGTATVGPPYGIGWFRNGEWQGHVILEGGDKWVPSSKLVARGTKLYWCACGNARWPGVATLDLATDVTTDPGDGSLHATPTLVWDRPSDSAYIPTGLTIDSEGMLYVILWGYKGNDRSILVKIDPETREWLWELELVGEDEDSIGVSDSYCIMVVDEPGHPYDGHVALTLYGYSWRNSGFLYIDRATGAIVRQYRNIVTYHPPLLYDGKYYSDASNTELRCVDAETGAIVWKYAHDTPEGDLGGTPLVVYKGIVYMATQWGLISFDAATGTPLFVDPSADTDGFTYNSLSRMIVVDDLLIYSNLDTHQLFAVRMDVHARR